MDIDALEKSLNASSRMERVVTVLLTLAKEYEDKAINRDRFAQRCFETLADYAKAVTAQ